jgi:sugar O-acyltransferase (sialic acid O-acetyltransferase NeuD family)
MKPPLLIVTASGLAREAAAAVRTRGDREVIGFLDDDAAQWGRTYTGVPVLGGIDVVAAHPGSELVICAGRGTVRQRLADRLAAQGVGAGRYATVIHPSVAVADDVSIGAGSVVLGGVVMTATVTLGRHTAVMPHVTLTHDDVVDEFATLCAGVALGGNVRVGARAYLGMRACVRENLSVGADAVVGMGAAVVRDVPEQQTWAGVPARPIGTPAGTGPVASFEMSEVVR